jgi:hypothetical protein
MQTSLDQKPPGTRPKVAAALRPRYLVAAGVLALGILWLIWLVWPAQHQSGLPTNPSSSIAPSSPAPSTPDDRSPTTVYAHNILLHKGPEFRIYIRWIRGQMLRAQPNITPSFDDPDSFLFLIQKGVINANLGDIGNFLNANVPPKFSLKNVTIRGEGDQVKLTGTMHKLHIPLPVELLSTVSATPDGRIHLHVNKINVLKVPVKGLLGGLHVEIDDIMGTSPMPGVQVSDNDLFFETTKLLPPPHIRGLLTSVTLASPDLVLIYGNAPNDESKLAQWHNFLRLNGGSLHFGKLTMHPTDLTLIDASDDAWFDLDLVNYQAQLVNGYSRMTPQAGLEIFMPDLDNQQQHKKTSQAITLEWLRNRARALPSDVPVK